MRIRGTWRLRAVYRSLRYLAELNRSPFLHFVPIGHYYSCVPDLKATLARADSLFRKDVSDCPGVDLRPQAQLAMLQALSVHYPDLPFTESPNPSLRYYYNNTFFTQGDAIVLYSLLRHCKPRRVIEIGSGFSSAVMLDTDDLFLNHSVDFTFIEPHPKRLFGLLGPNDRHRHKIIEVPAQDVPIEHFSILRDGDILFIDSSHVVKIGSDVVHLFFHVLPALQAGVIVHFHDILWPFEYPQRWLLEGRAWNEAYLLRAFLQFNGAFEILYFNSYMASQHRTLIEEKMPLCLKDPGGSLWMRKVKPAAET